MDERVITGQIDAHPATIQTPTAASVTLSPMLMRCALRSDRNVRTWRSPSAAQIENETRLFAVKTVLIRSTVTKRFFSELPSLGSALAKQLQRPESCRPVRPLMTKVG